MIEINNLTKIPVDPKFLKEIGQKILKKEGKDNKDLSIVLVGRKKIRELNRSYRKEDRATDVLSFEYNTLGEIVFCPEMIRKNAEKFNSTFKKELARVLIHGILHLLGYNHERSVAEAKKMNKKEESYLSRFKF
jgi:probable rRNA maturation factor